MKIKTLLLIGLMTLSAVTLSACYKHGPSHCPPGHAKKGYC